MNKHQVNAYFAALLIATVGVLAMWTIVRVAYRNRSPGVNASGVNTEASFQGLQNSILYGTSGAASTSAQ